MAKDLYEILGLSKSASKDEIKRAYRKLAMKYHPDRNQGDQEAEKKFKEISAAYDILKDDKKRAMYDQYGPEAFMGGNPGGGAGGGAPFGFDFDFGGSSFADIFEDLFGGLGGTRARRSPVNNRGADLRYNLSVSLEEAYAGTDTTVKVPTLATCGACEGSGSEGAKEPVTCSACSGSGRMRMQQGFFTMERTCPHCAGAGAVVENPCRTCHGQGRVQKQKTLSVTIPAGVEEGTRIRLTGEGEAGLRGSETGDLYIFISIRPHDLFERDGSNLHAHIPMPATLAMLGGEIEAPTISGSRAKIKIPPGTQHGDAFRLKGKGMSVLRNQGAFGDMYVHVKLETPVKLTKKQRELLEQFDAEAKSGAYPKFEKFNERVKQFLGRVKS